MASKEQLPGNFNLNANYICLDVDIADVWQYEFNAMQVTNKFDLYDKLLQTIEPIIASRCRPFLSDEEDAVAKAKYTKNYANYYALRQTDYFRYQGNYFEYKEGVIINRQNIDLKTMAFLFALKLRQYQDNLISLDAFLYYQLKTNFDSRLEDFLFFLKGLLIQFDEILEPRFEKKILLWKEHFNPFTNSQSGDYNLLNDPDCWTVIDKHISDERARAFFSFLYEERLSNGNGLLEKKEFDHLFRFGLKVPPVPLTEKLKLNTSPRFRKSIVESCTYWFYRRFSNNQKNKLPFLYFLAYQIEDFAQVKTPSQFKSWGKNFTEKKMQIELPFDIRKYLDRAK